MKFERYTSVFLTRPDKGIMWFFLALIIPLIVFLILVATEINPVASLVIAIIAYRQGVLFDKLAVVGTAMDAMKFDIANESLVKSDVEDIVQEKIAHHILSAHDESDDDIEEIAFYEALKK